MLIVFKEFNQSEVFLMDLVSLVPLVERRNLEPYTEKRKMHSFWAAA